MLIKEHIANGAYKIVDIVRIVNDGANLTLRTNSDRRKNIGTCTDKLIDLQMKNMQQNYREVI